MKIKVLTRVVHTIVLLFFFSVKIFGQDSKHVAEDLWQAIDFTSIKKAIQYQTGLSNTEIEMYMKFLDQKFPEERSQFFRKVESGEITQLNLPDFTNALTQKYINTYPSYEAVKTEFASQQNQNVYKPLSYNGPCENIDFEDGTTSGWQGSIATACENATPCARVNGFSPTRHEIMTAAMVDPYIPTLPVVAPGGNYSLRLENYVNGGNAASTRQTFLVTPTNNIFTYQYAAVLEDPDDHRDLERPYFKVRMYDQNGREINCATYTAIAKPPIQNFTLARVPNPNWDPTAQPGSINGSQFLNLYYRNWTTVTIPLLAYVGQNVTVEFTASDCSRGGHLGYAYIDASCSYLDTQIPPTLCGSDEDVTLYGPANFAKYQWSGPGIVGSATTRNIQVNKSGIYKLTLTPVADNPCPVTVQTIVPERCLPVPITAQACETLKGTRIKNGVNLNNYNTAITAYNSLARVLEWHSAIPATTANKIANPASINISNGSKYYAVIKYTSAGSDTAELRFTINSLPVLTFADINPLCKNGANVTIGGVSPTGGVFSGTHITSAGVFSPTATGTFPINYKYTSAAGCIDSIKKTITVNPPPTINLTGTQLLCATASTVNLTATATNQTRVEWSGGSGVFLNKQNITTEYTPTTNEKNSGSITLTLTITGISPCPAISDDIVVSFTPSPTVNAGADKDICVPVSAVIQLEGSSTNAQKNTWTGGSFSNANALNSIYQPTQSDIAAGSVTLTLTTLGKTPCAQVQDDVQIRFHESPNAIAGSDQTVCTGTTVSLDAAPVPGIIYAWESLYGTPISSTQSALIVADKDSVFVLKLKNQYNCIDSDTVKIDAFTPPTFNLGGPFCFSDQIRLNSNPVFPDPATENPVWYKDGNIIANAANFSLSVTQEGLYKIAYKQGKCEVSSSTNVFSNPILITPDLFTACENAALQLTTSNIPLATYYWKKNGAAVPGNTNSISIQVGSVTDQYMIDVIDQHNCTAKDSIKIIGIPQPILQLTDASICQGSNLHMDGTPLNASSLSNYSIEYKWFLNNVDIGQNANSIDVSTNGNYSLVAAVGICSDTARMTLAINPLPILDIPDVKKFCPESEPTIILNAGTHTSYAWTPSGETTQKISVSNGGLYSVTVYNNFDCFTKGTIEVKEICPPRLFVADAFSPNEDGTNDMFNVYGAHIGTYKLLIFNRWGEIIFESKDKDHFWDGVYKGEIMPIGVYPWIITYEGDSQEYLGPYKLEGSVTLVK